MSAIERYQCKRLLTSLLIKQASAASYYAENANIAALRERRDAENLRGGGPAHLIRGRLRHMKEELRAGLLRGDIPPIALTTEGAGRIHAFERSQGALPPRRDRGGPASRWWAGNKDSSAAVNDLAASRMRRKGIVGTLKHVGPDISESFADARKHGIINFISTKGMERSKARWELLRAREEAANSK